ncbi:MAG TPA: hypothetical protein VN937_24735 [Blastocatellia bacterium]|nr:hypothetical protein [Blastocatellia bacterium]
MEMTHLDLNSLRASEVISIYTANSVYQFSVTDPAQCAGWLSGGSLGDDPLLATLICSLTTRHRSADWLTLQPGAKAVFFCASTQGIRRLVTTRIQKIDCAECGGVEVGVVPGDSFRSQTSYS